MDWHFAERNKGPPLLKGRAGGKAKFHEKKLPALRSIK
jgi:hypothetical protein